MRKPGRPFLIHPSVQTSLTQNCLTITGFSYKFLSSLGRYVFGSEISYNKAPPRLPGLGC
jgi:hypothetical protein